MAPGPFRAEPSLAAVSRDGTHLALFAVIPDEVAMTPPATETLRATETPALLLVHGATADHTTWRKVGPRLAQRRSVFAMDRRGRGASGDGPAYAIEREYEDIAAAADAIGEASGGPV